MPGGRAVLFNHELQTQFCEMLKLGCSRAMAARAAGVSPRTVHRALVNSPEFRRNCLLAESEARMAALREIKRAARNNWRAAAWHADYVDRMQRGGRRKSRSKDSTENRDDELLNGFDIDADPEPPCGEADQATAGSAEASPCPDTASSASADAASKQREGEAPAEPNCADAPAEQ